jgi:hypothetical protein
MKFNSFFLSKDYQKKVSVFRCQQTEDRGQTTACDELSRVEYRR